MQKIFLPTRFSRKTRPVLLLFAAIFLLCGSVFAQDTKVSVHLKKANFAEVFREIEKQSAYRFFYNNAVVSSSHNLDVDADGKPVSEILRELFAGTGMNYRLVETYIVVTTRGGDEEEQFSKMIAGKEVVTGVVKDSQGEPLAGVSIVQQGTSNGTASDPSGRFSIRTMGSAPVLAFTYVGFQTQNVAVAGRAVVNVAMNPEDLTIDGVVITALGIKRETKSLTYDVQEVSSDKFTTVKDASFVNSLAGKISGVTINSSASGIGGSTRVVMRGAKSLFGNNNALYVVDGVPMPSLKTEQPSDFYKVPNYGDNDGISFLNPDDIQTVSVLTGSASAALYGQQGANGVIVITTRQGSPGKVRVSVSNNTMFMDPLVMPEFQTTYGAEEGSFQSWGAKLGTPSSYDPRDFFQTGYTVSNTVGVSFGTEATSVYASVGSFNGRGVVPNTKYGRYNFNMRSTSNLVKDKLTLDLGATYVVQNDQNQRAQGQYHNPLVPIYLFPPSDDIDKYELFERYNVERNFKTQYWPYGNMGMGMQNPYWITQRSMFYQDRDRYTLSAQLRWNIAPWVNISGRVKLDNTEAESVKNFYASSDKLFASDNGHYMDYTTTTKQSYADVIVNFDRKICRDWRVVANVGASLMDNRYDMNGYEGNLGLVANKFHVKNIDTTDPKSYPTEDGYHYQDQATFATMQFSYRSWAYLDLTGRVSWPSALYGADKSMLFYPSVGLSSVVSDIVDMNVAGISYLKLRASLSGVGNAPKPYYTYKATYAFDNGYYSTSTYPLGTWLKPERTESFEVGADVKFLRGMFTFNATYYDNNTYKQFFELTPPLDSEYTKIPLNAGRVRNHGVELGLGFGHTFGAFRWDSKLLYSRNINKIIELVPEGTQIDGYDFQTSSIPMSSALNNAYRMILTTGGTMGDVYVKGLRTDSHGDIWVSATTGEVQVSDTPLYAGTTLPDFNASWNNSFSWKGFNLNVLLDARVGGIVVSATQSYLDGFGVSRQSAEARDEGGVWINGGRNKVNPKNYYQTVGGGQTLAPYVYSATNVRLRELSLAYDLPSHWFGDKLNVTLSLAGRNLWMIYNKAPFDPELTASTETYYQGFDYFMQPSLRSIGFGVKIQF